ncbi:MAG: type II CAAX endopeptidase family protein [Actinomycetaceae bacterium]|nr:type II CAAX endopeptidase family protein [Actinomycetaceae bacterium]
MSNTDSLKMTAVPSVDNPPSKKKVPLGGPRDFLRGALGPKHKWWKVLLSGLIGIPLYYSFLFFGIRIILSLLGEEGQRLREFVTSGGNPMDKPMAVAVQLLPSALAILIFMIVLPLVGGRKFGALSSIKGRLRWDLVAQALLVAIPVMCSLILLQLIFVGPVDLRPYVLQILITLALIPFQAAAEEYLFRGWFVQALGVCRVPVVIVLLVSSIVFALAHTNYGVIGLLSVASMGLSCVWLTMRTGGLEGAIVGHAVFNIVAGINSFFSGGNPGSDAGRSWDGVVVTGTVFLLYTIIADIWLRRAIIKREGREVMVGALGGPIGTFGEDPAPAPAIEQAPAGAPQGLKPQVQYSA